jgi:hypothetical protein
LLLASNNAARHPGFPDGITHPKFSIKYKVGGMFADMPPNYATIELSNYITFNFFPTFANASKP